MKSGLTVVVDRVAKVQKAIASLTQSVVLVGIPSAKAERKPDENGEQSDINNAAIGYIMEKGAPELNIPARPFLLPGIKNVQDEIATELRHGSLDVIAGNNAGMQQALRRAGQIGATAVADKIDDGPFTALSDRTLRARARKQAVSGGTKADRKAAKEALASGDYSGIDAKPLIDTGQLLRALTYVIRKRF